MTEVLQAAMTPPTTNGDAPMPRPVGARTMLLGRWGSRSVRVAFVDVNGGGRAWLASSHRTTPRGGRSKL